MRCVWICALKRVVLEKHKGGCSRFSFYEEQKRIPPGPIICLPTLCFSRSTFYGLGPAGQPWLGLLVITQLLPSVHSRRGAWPFYFLGDEWICLIPRLPHFLLWVRGWMTYVIDWVSYEQGMCWENEMKNGLSCSEVYFPNQARENSFSK